MTRFSTTVMLCVLALAGESTAPGLEEDSPSMSRAVLGKLRGKIALPEGQGIAVIQAVCREDGKSYSASKWDRKSGRFTFNGLPGDASYDIQLLTESGRRLEGIDLDYVDAKLLQMAARRREQLGLPPEGWHEFTEADARELAKYVEKMKDFMDIRRVLYIRGHGRRATMLVELIRASDFHARKRDELIWRIELWYFERSRGGWRRVENVERVIERQRLSAKQWQKLHVEYFPELTVRLDATGTAGPLYFRVPDKADPSRGRVPGTEITVKTGPHVLGLANQPEPTSRPASSRASTRPSGQAPPAH